MEKTNEAGATNLRSCVSVWKMFETWFLSLKGGSGWVSGFLAVLCGLVTSPSTLSAIRALALKKLYDLCAHVLVADGTCPRRTRRETRLVPQTQPGAERPSPPPHTRTNQVPACVCGPTLASI